MSFTPGLYRSGSELRKSKSSSVALRSLLQTQPVDTLVSEEHTQIESHNLRVDCIRSRNGKRQARGNPGKHAVLRPHRCTHQLSALSNRTILLFESTWVSIDRCLSKPAKIRELIVGLEWGDQETGSCGEAASGIEREEGDGVAGAVGFAENEVLACITIADYNAVDGTGGGCNAEAEIGVLWGGRGG